ncbi:hypothetical protein RJ640_019981, partial [Escallonia rubra]
GSASVVTSSETSSTTAPSQPKRCSECHTKKTPLWRSGPPGPKSLCNACGIKYNKKRKALLGLDKRTKKGFKHKKNSDDTEMSLKLRLMALGDEERAAMLLMALSCGSALYD